MYAKIYHHSHMKMDKIQFWMVAQHVHNARLQLQNQGTKRRFVTENFAPQLSLYINEKIPFLPLKQILKARYSNIAVPSIKNL